MKPRACTRRYARSVKLPRLDFVRLGASAISARQKPAEIQSVIDKVARSEQLPLPDGGAAPV